MSINRLNIAMGASSWGAYSQKLSPATKAKLARYGIPYDERMTEQEGRQLIAQYERAHNNQADLNKNKQFEQNNSGAKDDVKQRLLQLAKEVGVSVNEQDENKKIASLIEQTLEDKISKASDNKPLLEQLKNLSRDLASIQAQQSGSSGYDNTNQALMMSLELLSQYNKNFMYR